LRKNFFEQAFGAIKIIQDPAGNLGSSCIKKFILKKGFFRLSGLVGFLKMSSLTGCLKNSWVANVVLSKWFPSPKNPEGELKFCVSEVRA